MSENRIWNTHVFYITWVIFFSGCLQIYNAEKKIIMKKKIARKILYGFLFLNIIGLIYFSYVDHNFINIDHIKDYLRWPNLYIALVLYTFLLTIRWLTIFPGTPLLIAWTLIFPKIYVIFSVEIAILFYTLIIYKYNEILNFKVPSKLMRYKEKLQRYETPYIIALCLIPWVSINGLAYFFSVLKIELRQILIWMWIGTIITTSIYINIFDSLFNFAF
jgi:uncharacterized membrane protein YdjX (TVP38/TMEM64 family)